MFPNLKGILSTSFLSVSILSGIVACGSGNHDSKVSQTSANGSQSFNGPVANKLVNAMAKYPNAVRTSSGYMLRGLNTTISCSLDGLCTVQGPAVQNGALKIDLGSYTVPANSTFKPIQQQLFEAVDPVSDGGIRATGISSSWICEIVQTGGARACDKAGDEISVGTTYDQFNPNQPRVYSAAIYLVPALPGQSRSFSGLLADKLTNALSKYSGTIRSSSGQLLLRDRVWSVLCSPNGICTVKGPGLRGNSREINLGEVTVPSNSNSKPLQQQLYEAVGAVRDGGLGTSGFSQSWLCEEVEASGSGKLCAQSGDELSVSVTNSPFNPSIPNTYSASFRLVDRAGHTSVTP